MPSSATKTPRRREGARALEDDAIDRLLRHLASRGIEATLTGRPDRESVPRRAVDAQLLVDGRTVGLEVTQLLPGARAHYEIARLERQIEAHVRPEVANLDLGYVAIDVHYRRLPAKADLRSAVQVLVGEISDALRALSPRPEVRQDVRIDSSLGFIRRLGLLQLPSEQPGLGWIGGSDEFGGWIQPMADEFVGHLLATKASQTAGYGEAWMLIVDRVGLIDAGDLIDAFRRKLDAVPANWTHCWLSPATDRSKIVPLAIRPGAG